jgi:hypothetical protein
VTSKFVLRIPFVTQYKITLTLGVNELRRIRREEHFSRMGGNRNSYKVLVGRTEEKCVFVGPEERTMLKLISNRMVRRKWTAVSGSSWISDRLLWMQS